MNETTKQFYIGMINASWGQGFASAVMEFAIANGEVKSANVDEKEINVMCKNGKGLQITLGVE